jgi:glycosyltransferase involved in cell wall biosynthesis
VEFRYVFFGGPHRYAGISSELVRMQANNNKVSRRLGNITTVVVNYRTRDLTERCIESFLKHYPDIRLILIDNGSRDNSTEYVKHVSRDNHAVTCVINEKNRYHGPAMDQGVKLSTTRYVFTLDSDCEILRGGFLEEMLALFADPNLYAVGRLVHMDRYGFEAQAGRGRRIRYVHPSAMLLDREKYLTLKSFVHHGSPCIKNMKDAAQVGYKLRDFPLSDFVRHYGRGTCSRYGYGLSPRTSVERLLSRLGLFI